MAFPKFGVGLRVLFVCTFAATSWCSPLPSTEDCMQQWLCEIGIEQISSESYASSFKQKGINEIVLKQLTIAQLELLGVSLFGHQTLIYNSIRNGALPCGHGGSCDISGDKTVFSCSCLEGFGGSQCEQVIGCGTEVCLNGGVCSEDSGAVTCQCTPGHSGEWCQEDACVSQPCQNGGTCSPSNLTGYSCSCLLGYSGSNCETAWLSRTSYQYTLGTIYRTLVKVLTLERKVDAHIEKVDDFHEPHFFGQWLELSNLKNISQAKLFSVGTDKKKYIVILTTGILSIYELPSSKGEPLLVQTISMINAVSFQVFEITDVYYIAVARWSEAGLSNSTQSLLFKWNTSNRNFETVQEFATMQAVDVDYVHIPNRGKFLAFSCIEEIYSVVYVWLPTQERFDHYQFLPTVDATKLSFVSTDSNTFLTIASNHGNMGMVFLWNGTYFTTFQEVESCPTCSSDFYTFAMGNFVFALSISQTDSNSIVYRLDNSGYGYIPHSTIPTSSDSTVQYMSINNEHFLAVSNPLHANHTIIYKLSGTIFEPFQELDSPADVRGLGFVTCGDGSQFLTVANSEQVEILTWSDLSSA